MLNGKIAWVTGATGGLGPDVVRRLAAEGATIVATARDQDALAAMELAVGLPAERWLSLAGDLADAEVAERLAATATGRYGGLDILVTVAGGWRGGKTVAETDPATLEWLWRTNLVTAFNAAHAALPRMLARGWGRLITLSARPAQGGAARSGAYAASKAALLALTQSIALETRGQGITANALLVGTIDTPANRAAMPTADTGRWTRPDQIAAAIAFLCSDDAAAISGVALPI